MWFIFFLFFPKRTIHTIWLISSSLIFLISLPKLECRFIHSFIYSLPNKCQLGTQQMGLTADNFFLLKYSWYMILYCFQMYNSDSIIISLINACHGKCSYPPTTVQRYYNIIGYISYAVFLFLWLIYFITGSLNLFVPSPVSPIPPPTPHGNQQSVTSNYGSVSCLFSF